MLSFDCLRLYNERSLSRRSLSTRRRLSSSVEAQLKMILAAEVQDT